jgi:hypothetical protein
LNEQDGRILHGNLERLDQGIPEDVSVAEVVLVNLALGHEALVASQLA